MPKFEKSIWKKWPYLLFVFPLAQACVQGGSPNGVTSGNATNCPLTNVLTPAYSATATATYTGTFVTQRAEPCDYFYNYAPETLYDGSTYHMYWCAGIGDVGDNILHAESTVATGPFHAHTNTTPGTYDISLAPSKTVGTLDRFEVCDPNVLLVNGVYYMYYGGLAAQTFNAAPTIISLATSTDGITFQRTGLPLVTPVQFPTANANLGYGTGPPTVIYYSNYFYMLFTDSTAPGSNQVNGAGQYLIRSQSPAFTNPQEMVSAGTWSNFQPNTSTNTSTNTDPRTGVYSLLEAFSVDMALDPQSGKVLIANDTNSGSNFLTGIYSMDPSLFSSTSFVKPTQLASGVPGTWRDGPGIVKQPNHTLATRPSCASLPIRVYHGDSISTSNTGDVKTWDLSTDAATVDLTALCQ